jgi:hypothetical protein
LMDRAREASGPGKGFLEAYEESVAAYNVASQELGATKKDQKDFDAQIRVKLTRFELNIKAAKSKSEKLAAENALEDFNTWVLDA